MAENQQTRYDVIVVGAGHAGCEAALAAARMGCTTLVVTGDRDRIAFMPCNPSIGGPAKGHLVREIDALGGEMGKNTDRTLIQIRLLNSSKGPAVQALRAQSDKHLYAQAMRQVLESEANVTIHDGLVEDLLTSDSAGNRRHVTGVQTKEGRAFYAQTVVLTTGTFLQGMLITGEKRIGGGRAGEAPAQGLSHCPATPWLSAAPSQDRHAAPRAGGKHRLRAYHTATRLVAAPAVLLYSLAR